MLSLGLGDTSRRAGGGGAAKGELRAAGAELLRICASDGLQASVQSLPRLALPLSKVRALLSCAGSQTGFLRS